MTELSTQERNIAQVFQFPVIYDTMTVYDNLAFPLRNRGVPEADVDRKVREIARDDRPRPTARASGRAGLTADQKQKISLGRGLVRSDVNAILFDEPLTVIDPHMKWVLRSQLKQLHRRFGYTMVYVTHDQTEALTFADKVVVMYEGEIVQIGTPAELFERPAHTFVGYFIGSPGMNVLPVAVEGRRRGSAASRSSCRRRACRGRRAARSSSASGRNSSSSARERHAGRRSRKVEDIGRHKIVARQPRGPRDRRDRRRGRARSRPTPQVGFDPAGINLYADSWRVEMAG